MLNKTMATLDALAKAANEQSNLDKVSLADFILNDVVTFPYTAYTNLRQELAGSIISFSTTRAKTVSTYWQPIEKYAFENINEAALSLRHGIKKYIDAVTENMSNIAHREGRIAQKAAKAYGLNFTVGYRDALHYLDIQPAASALVGLGHQYSHAHSLTFDKQFDLPRYDALFGGYLADSLLKGAYAPKPKGIGRIPFLPQREVNRSPILTCTHKISEYIKKDLIKVVKLRQKTHMEWIKSLRPNSADEWFVLYPATMRITIPNFYSSRRLFKSYEPFLSHSVVKTAAEVPTHWKLNRRLFQKAMQPFLKQSQWIFHADGRLPYYPWWFNMPIQAYLWPTRKLITKIGLSKVHQGPWGRWKHVFSSYKWKKEIDTFNKTTKSHAFLQDSKSLEETFNLATTRQKINLFQTCYYLHLTYSA